MKENEAELLGIRLDQLIDQYRRGEPVDIEAFCREQPHLAEKLRELFNTQCALEAIKLDRLGSQPCRLNTPPTLPGYKIVREVARGGMGVVYEAVHLSLSRRVALKVISSHLQGKEDSVKRFKREAQVASQLHHSNIVPVFDVGQEGSVRYYSMQFIRGQSLDQIIEQMRISRASSPELNPDNFKRVARLGVQIADALSAAHSVGILHRDVKPANILVDEQDVAWLTDFGLATLVEDDSDSPPLTGSGELLGTLRYMAPERITGQQDIRSDIYALSATLYEMLTLRTVFSGSDRIQILHQISHDPIIPPRQFAPEIPRDLETILLKGLCKEPERRYQAASLLADDLRLLLLDRPIRARRIGWLEVTLRWFYRNPVLAGCGSALVLLLMVTLLVWNAKRSLETQRDELQTLVQRARMAENETHVRMLINDVASYRMTQEPELSFRRRELQALARTKLPQDLRMALRHEIAACWMRADWFTDEVSVKVAATRIALNRNRSRMALIDAEGSVEICDYPSLENSVVVPALTFVPQALQFTRDGQYLIVSVDSLYQVCRSSDGRPVYAGAQVVDQCEVSGQSHRAAFLLADSRITVESLDAQPTRLIMELQAQPDVEAIKLSPTGDRLAYLAKEQLIIVRVPGGHIESTTKLDHSGLLAWSPNGKWLAITDHEYGIEVWDADSAKRLTSLPSVGSFIAYLDWDAGSQLLASQTWDGCFQVQHAWSGRLLARTKRPVGQVEFSDDSRTLGWILDQGQVRMIHWFGGFRSDIPGIAFAQQESPLTMAFHPSQALMAVGTTSRILLTDLRSGDCKGEVPVNQLVALGFDKTGDQLNVLTTSTAETWSIDRPSENARCELVRVGVSAVPKLTSGFWLADGPRAIATSTNQELLRIDLKPETTTRVLGSSNGLAVKPLGQGRLLALHDWRQPFIDIRQTETGELIGRIIPGENSLAFADPAYRHLIVTNGRTIQSATFDDLVSPMKIIMRTTVVGSQVAFTSDGQIMAIQSVPYELELIRWSTGECLTKLASDFNDNITQLAFDSNGRYLVALCARTGVVRKWDVHNLNSALREDGLEFQ